MIRPLRVAHTSDVHLHDGDDGAHVRAAFRRVIDSVLETRAELFLIAGDLFDDNRVGKKLIEFVQGELARVPCPTVIIAGNHDCWEERSVLKRMDFGAAGGHVTALDSIEAPPRWGRANAGDCACTIRTKAPSRWKPEAGSSAPVTCSGDI